MPKAVALDAANENGKGIPESILFGRSAAMREVRSKIGLAAPTDIPVLIVGESGTGKEVIARYIHSRSPRGSGPFVRINCPGIPGALVESEMFGYEKGAFTGAGATKAGLVEFAAGGTLFLDSMAELEFSLQSKFLQFMQDHQFSRIGGQESLRADTRIVCAANRPLEREVELGHFRQDLLYRLNAVTIDLPPLRERQSDIPDLIEFFVVRFSMELGRTARPLSANVRNLLATSDWPGNIRQLENVIKRYVIFGDENSILGEVWGRDTVGLYTATCVKKSLKQITKQAVQQIERRAILEALAANRWNRRRTAQDLSISYRALLYKMKESGIPQKRLTSSSSVEAQDRDD